MYEDKVPEPIEYQAMRQAISAAERSAEAQEAILEEQRQFRHQFKALDMRDVMAAAAMQACPGWMQDRIETYPEMARRCYLMADAMLKAREVE